MSAPIDPPQSNTNKRPALQDAIQSKAKRRKKKDSEDPETPFIVSARFIPRAISTFPDILAILEVGLKRDGIWIEDTPSSTPSDAPSDAHSEAPSDTNLPEQNNAPPTPEQTPPPPTATTPCTPDDEDDTEFADLDLDEESDAEEPTDEDRAKELAARRQQNLYRDYNRMLALADGFKDYILKLDTNDKVNDFIQKLRLASQNAREGDTGKVKRMIPTFIEDNFRDDLADSGFANPSKESIPVVPKDKAERGWQHIIYARLLCPITEMDAFEANPSSFLNDVAQNGSSHSADNYPRFMYAAGKPEDFCLGPLLYQVFEEIFLSSSKTYREGRRRKANVARIGSITRIIPQMIAYTACQTYFSLSSMPEWDETDGDFSITSFNDAILDMFKYDPNWAKSTLEIWNKKYFPDSLSTAKDTQKDTPLIVNKPQPGSQRETLEKLIWKRQKAIAKAKAKKQAAAPAVDNAAAGS